LTINLVKAQTNEILLLDQVTKEPISSVNVFNPESLNGTISNDDGWVSIYFRSDTLICSHVSYETKKIFRDRLIEKDTVYLTPSEIQLDEIVVNTFDLKKRLKFIINNYNELYDVKSKLFDCTYKEKLKVNNKIARLTQVQLKWWDKNYNFNFKGKLDKLCQFKLNNIDYSKILDTENILSNGAFIENKYLIEFLHLNYYLFLITSYADNIQITSIEKDIKHTKIIFSADIIVNNKLISKVVNSTIYFDNKTMAIKNINLNLIYNNQVKEGVSKNGNKHYKSTMKLHNIVVNFNEYHRSKLIINSFYSKVKAIAEYENKIDDLLIEQNFLITGIKYGNRIRKKHRINLSDPFYKNLPTTKSNHLKILLNKEEIMFMKEK